MDISEFVNVSNIPTGRRIYAHRQVRERLDERTMKDIVVHVDKAIEHDRETLQVELSRQGVSQSRYGATAVRLDGLLDRAVTGLESFFDSFIRIYGPKHELGAIAAEVSGTIFPAGAGDITKLPFVQEDEAVAAVLDRLQQKPMQELLSKLPAVDGLIAQIGERHREYHEELHKHAGGPSREDLRDMRYRGQQNINGTVTLILAYYVRTGDDKTTNYLLEPIRRQLREVRDIRRRRRAVSDVNPDTGEVDPGEATPEPPAADSGQE